MGIQAINFGSVATGGGLNYSPVTWTGKDDVTESPTGTLTKDFVAGDGWNAGAYSVEGITGDGGVRWTVNDNSAILAFGVSETPVSPPTTFGQIDYSFIILSSSDVRVYEGGSNQGSVGSVSNGDVYEIIRSGTSLLFKIDGSTVATLSVSSSTTLKADVQLYTTSIAFSGVEIST